MAIIEELTVKLHVDVKTLRDEFAMAALPSCVSRVISPNEGRECVDTLMDRAAYWAYVAADAMMEARKS